MDKQTCHILGTTGGSVGWRSRLHKSVEQHSMVRLGCAFGESWIKITTNDLDHQHPLSCTYLFLDFCSRITLHWKCEPSYLMQPEVRTTSPFSSSSMMAKHWPLVLCGHTKNIKSQCSWRDEQLEEASGACEYLCVYSLACVVCRIFWTVARAVAAKKTRRVLGGHGGSVTWLRFLWIRSGLDTSAVEHVVGVLPT